MTLTDRILRRLDHEFGWTATAIAHSLKANPASVSSILNRLAKAQRVYRKTFPELRTRTYRGGWCYFR